jgi:predicted transposase YbfD/YdcC
VVLDRLDPRALTRALPGDRRRVRAVAVDGKTSRGARRPDGTRVHLLGVLEHGGPLLDHPEVDVKHNETTDLLDLLEPLDLTGVVVTFDALHTVRTNLDRLVRSKDAHNVAVVKKNQPLLHARLKALPRQDVPTGSTTPGTGHGRTGTRTLEAAHVQGLDLPHARQAIKITRSRQDTGTGRTSRQTLYALTTLTSDQADAHDLARIIREHWSVEAHHHVRDVTHTKDTATSRTGHGPTNLATIRAAIINTLKDAGYLHILRRPPRPHHPRTGPPPPRPHTTE